MSYCRFSEESEVYVYHSVNGRFICCGCCLMEPVGAGLVHYERSYGKREQLIEHLKKHIAAGHKVPARVFDRLEQEMREN